METRRHLQAKLFNLLEYKKYTKKDLGVYIYIYICIYMCTVGEKIIWSPADFVRLPTDKEMISL